MTKPAAGTESAAAEPGRLSPRAQELLAAAGRPARIRRGGRIYLQGEESRELRFLKEGYAAISRSGRFGQEKLLFVCSPGELLNEECLQAERCYAGARALSDVELLCVGRKELKAMLEQDSRLAGEIFGSLLRKTRRLYHLSGSATGAYPLEKRLAARLLKLAKEYGEETRQDKGRRIPFRVSVSFLAELTGAKRESISRYISEFRRKGYLTLEDGVLTVTDPEGLSELLRP